VADAGGSGQRRTIQCGGEVAELALGAARLPSLPSARRRSMWPFTNVAMPALS
jgi:hypothetical protein